MQKIPKIKYLEIWVLGVEVVLWWFLHRVPTSAFSQNLLKTLTFALIALLPLYLYVLVFRVVKRKSLSLSLRQLVWFVMYLMAMFIFAFGVDAALEATNYEINKIAGNIIAFVSVFIFWLSQRLIPR